MKICEVIEKGIDVFHFVRQTSCPANTIYSAYYWSGDDLPYTTSFSECSQGLVQFRTDHSVVSSGFSLKYYVNEAGMVFDCASNNKCNSRRLYLQGIVARKEISLVVDIFEIERNNVRHRVGAKDGMEEEA